jgi:hypothetical protein
MKLWDHQQKALDRLSNGSVLVGGTGSGKSLTALAYYKKVLGEHRNPPKAIFVITTAKKRDEGDWVREAAKLGIDDIIVDSWNNIKKYIHVKDSMFIFDEQRVIGYGTWTKSFLRITNYNRWILLSATPADTWTDLIPVFIANGFVKNKTEFNRNYVIFAPYVTFPKIIGYRNESLLERWKDLIFVIMTAPPRSRKHVYRLDVDYNKELVDHILKHQWNPYTDRPIESLAEEVYTIRRVVNSHPSRIIRLVKLHDKVKKLIIFYNFNFELDLLLLWFEYRTTVGQMNGHLHQPLPDTEDWVYLVQYNSGSEAWECFTTNHMAFYSMNYSYRTLHQARGRIARNNTTYDDLYYYELWSDSLIDSAIFRAFKNKKNFNVRMLNLKFKENINE